MTRLIKAGQSVLKTRLCYDLGWKRSMPPGVLAQSPHARSVGADAFVDATALAFVGSCGNVGVVPCGWKRNSVGGRGLLDTGGRCHSRTRTRVAARRRCATSALDTDASNTGASHVVQEEGIFALSSGAGVTAGVAVVRISGNGTLEAVRKMLSSPSAIPKPREAALRRLRHPSSREHLDSGLVILFPAPRSFTGEDVAELHLHGSRAVVAAVSNALLDCGIRPAGRGEFTRRAFENGRMDLTEVEGLADLIAADTDEQRRQALRQMGGDVKAVFEVWREELKGCLAHAEAVIDFGDDVDDGAFEAVIPRVAALREEMLGRMDDDRRGEIVRGGVRVAIVGPPNAGKSTLLNILARRPAAIVSPVAGTTRDIVEVSLDMNGVPVIVSDTAGLREATQDVVEIEGMKRAREAAAVADITIYVEDVTKHEAIPDQGPSSRSHALPLLWDDQTGIETNASSRDEVQHESRNAILVLNKTDLVEAESHKSADGTEVQTFRTSLKDGVGVDELVLALESSVKSRLDGEKDPSGTSLGPRDPPIITRSRHRFHVERAVDALQAFESGRTGPNRDHYLPMDLATEELRMASRELGAVTGVIHVEEVLDVVFSDFCIGK